MKAQTLALCLPLHDGCNKKCPYCISKMTWSPKIDPCKWCHNLEMVRRFADRSQVTDIIVTAKGEPTLDTQFIQNQVIRHFGHYPIVLQTNGLNLLSDTDSKFRSLCNVIVGSPFKDQEDWGGINVIAVSIDHPHNIEEFSPIWEECHKMGIIPRITVMLTPEVVQTDFDSWVDICKKHGILQMSFRDVTIPTDRVRNTESNKTAKWIQENIEGNMDILLWKQNFNRQTNDNSRYREIRRLPYGAVIKDVRGVAVTLFNYCIQDNSGDEDIRSLIYNQDGHLYTTWNSPASVIF